MASMNEKIVTMGALSDYTISLFNNLNKKFVRASKLYTKEEIDAMLAGFSSGGLGE